MLAFDPQGLVEFEGGGGGGALQLGGFEFDGGSAGGLLGGYREIVIEIGFELLGEARVFNDDVPVAVALAGDLLVGRGRVIDGIDVGLVGVVPIATR